MRWANCCWRANAGDRDFFGPLSGRYVQVVVKSPQFGLLSNRREYQRETREAISQNQDNNPAMANVAMPLTSIIII